MTLAEIQTARAASNAVSSLASATSTLLQVIRRNGIVRSAERDRLREYLAACRREDVASYIGRLGLVNMNWLFEMYDKAEAKVGNLDAYAQALSIISQTLRHLESNLQRLVHELG